MYKDNKLAILGRPITLQQLNLISRIDLYSEITSQDSSVIETTTEITLTPRVSAVRIEKSFDPYPRCFVTKPKIKREEIKTSKKRVVETVNRWVTDPRYFRYGDWINGRKERRVVYVFAQ